jgi:hypothetical protein
MNIKVIFFAVMGLVTMQSGLAITPVATQSNPFEGAYGQMVLGTRQPRSRAQAGEMAASLIQLLIKAMTRALPALLRLGTTLQYGSLLCWGLE